MSIRKIICAITITLAAVSCGKKQRAPNEVIVGTIAGPETTLMEVAKDVAKEKYNIDLKIVQFNDYVLPNTALADGSIDANMFQHMPYLQATMKAKGYNLTSIGKTFIYPMGIYSKKIKSLRELKDGSSVAIPNDPSNEARALLLLQNAGLITLKKSADVTATVNDIATNPKKLQFKEMDAAQLPRVLDDVTLAAINTNYAVIANLLPTRDAIFMEKSDSPYANIVVIRAEDKSKENLQHLVAALQSNKVLAKSKELFQGQAIAAWQ